jgi:5-formyltetrahydrofolate cyclo-ligase
MNKQTLRQALLARRRSLSIDFIKIGSAKINEWLCSWAPFQNARTVMTFLSMPDEPQMDEMISLTLQSGKTVCVPHLRSVYGYMDASRLTGTGDLVPGRLGLRVPNPDKIDIVSPGDIDLILVPGVVFDLTGQRIGMGAGYYDRFLIAAPQAMLVGVAWRFQLIAEIPQEKHDIPMHWIVTEDGIYDCIGGKI